ncbi:uncharacterized protein wu:fb74b10 [Notolabrus celidotus]|uniref:uncharacterized protein wu:fb74b10 n=1 Tax=Notolabrus celidotus TaxID=1203425 RepID=UPI0014904203|nr:uncharacterized protein wu:fb74b10 [Notolabrus celidotus]
MEEREREVPAVKRRKWTVQKEERMVELWADQPCLFDINSRTYHDRVEKEKQWTEIAEALQMPVAEVKTRSLSLRTQFSRLLRPRPSGSGEKTLTSKQKWILRGLDFLKPFVTPRNTETSLVIEDDETDTQGTMADDEVSSLVENSTLDKDITESVFRPCTPGSSRSSSPPPSEPRVHQSLNKKARRVSDNEIELEKLELLKEMSKANNK